MNKQQAGGRGSNLTDDDRKRGGEHSHKGSHGNQSGKNSNLSQADKKKGDKHSHGDKS